MGLQQLRDRLSRDEGGGRKGAKAVDEAFQKKMPSLWEFLAETSYPDGAERETGTILVFVEEGLVKACVCNRDSGHVAFVSADTWADLFSKVEKGLTADSLDWRLSRRDGKGKAKKS